MNSKPSKALNNVKVTEQVQNKKQVTIQSNQVQENAVQATENPLAMISRGFGNIFKK
jgi:hypothetical protein